MIFCIKEKNNFYRVNILSKLYLLIIKGLIDLILPYKKYIIMFKILHFDTIK